MAGIHASSNAFVPLLSHRPMTRYIRCTLYWLGFFGLLALMAIGFRQHPRILEDVWTPAGQFRFLAFAAGYAIVAALVFVVAPGRLPALLTCVAAVVCCGATGLGGFSACVLVLLSAAVLGRGLLFRGAIDGVDLLLSTLCGSVAYMTLVGMTIGLPIHFPILYSVLLIAPLVVWRQALRDTLVMLRGILLRPVAYQTGWDHLGFALFAFIPLVLLVNVLLPQVNNDAVVAHLAIPSIVADQHLWPFDVRHAVFAVMPFGLSWLMVPPFLLGGEYAARLLNFSFYIATALMLFSASRQYLSIGTAWLIVAIYASTPFFQAETGNIFVENLWTALLFGGFLALQRFWVTKRSRYFLASAMLAPASLAVKVIGAVAVMIICTLSAWYCRRNWVLLAAGIVLAALVSLYPYVHAYWLTGNPVFPLMNDVFRSSLFPPSAFIGLGRNTLPNPYVLTFETLHFTDGGGRDGSFGFAYLLLFPLALLALRPSYPRFGWVSLVIAASIVVSEWKLAEVNARYLYPALPFGMVAVAIAFQDAQRLSQSLFAALCAYGIAVTALNSYAMPVSGWAYRDFPIASMLSRIGVDQRRDEQAPERRLIDYLDLTRGRNLRVAMFSRPMLVDLKGEAVFTNWYNSGMDAKLRAVSNSPEDILRLMQEQHITNFMAFTPDSGIVNDYPAVDAFLKRYTEPEFTVGDAYVARFKPEYRFSNEVLTNGSFKTLEGWTPLGAGPGSADGTVVVNEVGGLAQHVPIDDRLRYRYVLMARCPNPGSRIRLQLSWQDATGRELSTLLLAKACSEIEQNYSEDVTPPSGAQGANVVLLGLDSDKPAVLYNVSLRW